MQLTTVFASTRIKAGSWLDVEQQIRLISPLRETDEIIS